VLLRTKGITWIELFSETLGETIFFCADDDTRTALVQALTKVFEDLTRRDPDEIFKRSHEVLELTQAADIVHGWSREKPDVWY
jgi:hypothetical protein